MLDSKRIKGITLLLIVMLFSCDNSLEKIETLSDSFKIPSNSIENFSLYFTDSSRVKVKLKSPLLINNDNEKDAKEINKEFPKGISVIFFDDSLKRENFMKADYSIHFPNKKFLEARGNVIIINKNNDSILTEKIYWDQKEKIIYSNDYTKIIQEGQIIIGKNGFRSDENFTWYEIFNTEGDMYIKDSI